MTPDRPLLLRPHHALCLAAFCGEGYSEAFIRRMTAIQADYLSNRPFRITGGPDPICALCPNRRGRECGATEGTPSRELDERVSRRLGLESRELWTWEEVAARLQKLPQTERDALCAGCSWFEKSRCGYCITRRLAIRHAP